MAATDRQSRTHLNVLFLARDEILHGAQSHLVLHHPDYVNTHAGDATPSAMSPIFTGVEKKINFNRETYFINIIQARGRGPLRIPIDKTDNIKLYVLAS